MAEVPGVRAFARTQAQGLEFRAPRTIRANWMAGGGQVADQGVHGMGHWLVSMQMFPHRGRGLIIAWPGCPAMVPSIYHLPLSLMRSVAHRSSPGRAGNATMACRRG